MENLADKVEATMDVAGKYLKIVIYSDDTVLDNANIELNDLDKISRVYLPHVGMRSILTFMNHPPMRLNIDPDVLRDLIDRVKKTIAKKEAEKKDEPCLKPGPKKGDTAPFRRLRPFQPFTGKPEPEKKPEPEGYTFKPFGAKMDPGVHPFVTDFYAKKYGIYNQSTLTSDGIDAALMAMMDSGSNWQERLLKAEAMEPAAFTFQEYEDLIEPTSIYPNRGDNLAYPLLGLAGEAGVIAEKAQKILRDDPGKEMTRKTKREFAHKLGNVLGYVRELATQMGYSLEKIADMNAKKVVSRLNRGVINGSGDNR